MLLITLDIANFVQQFEDVVYKDNVILTLNYQIFWV